MHPLGHFITITHHKLLVMSYCFRVGLIRQGLLHDLSKYSWTEFRIGARYYSGTRSPNAAEREVLGYSTAWLHHKGRNKHHLEYWMDYGGPGLQMAGQPMPTKYMVELCLDRISACRVYHGKDYTDRDPLNYLNHSLDSSLMHPDTHAQVVHILTMLAEKGERETLRYLRQEVLKHPVSVYPNLKKPYPHPEEKDHTFLEGEALQSLADRLGTPFYIYSEALIRDQAKALRQAFSWNPGYRQFFPMKASPTLSLLRILQEEGQGIVCSSAAELALCQKCGFLPEQVLFMPNFPTQEDLDQAASFGCRCMLDGIDLVEEYSRRSIELNGVGLRLNPGGVFRFGNQEVRLDSLKFGLTPEAAEQCVRELQRRGVTSIGLHTYLAGNTLEPDYYPAVAKKLISLALELSEKTGIQISYLNLSGGLGIPYLPGALPLDIAKIGAAVKTVVQEQTAGTPLDGVAIHTELGRFVTGSAGLLVTRVTHVRDGFRKIAGVDASAANLMRPMMYGAYHHISVAGQERSTDREKWDVVGTVCESTDKFAENRLLPQLNVGDVLAIHDVGAHGYSMGYQYGGRLRCGEYLLRPDGSVTQIRRPETQEDYFSTLVF